MSDNSLHESFQAQPTFIKSCNLFFMKENKVL